MKLRTICFFKCAFSQTNLTDCEHIKAATQKEEACHCLYPRHIVNIWPQETPLLSLVKTSRTESERKSYGGNRVTNKETVWQGLGYELCRSRISELQDC